MIFLFTDFGSADLYLGQVKAELARRAPGVAVIDWLNDAPCFDIHAGAHLLAALAQRAPPGSVILAVVDPGVGSERRPVVVGCDERYFVGPDNGLMSIVARRAARVRVWEIAWRPRSLARSFHGRDLFAPIAARLAAGPFPADALRAADTLAVRVAETAETIIYIDHYGNGMTGIPASGVPESARIGLNGRSIAHAGVFAEVPPGTAFWYANSLGLVEIACNRAHAQAALGFELGDRVTIERGQGPAAAAS